MLWPNSPIWVFLEIKTHKLLWIFISETDDWGKDLIDYRHNFEKSNRQSKKIESYSFQ